LYLEQESCFYLVIFVLSFCRYCYDKYIKRTHMAPRRYLVINLLARLSQRSRIRKVTSANGQGKRSRIKIDQRTPTIIIAICVDAYHPLSSNLWKDYAAIAISQPDVTAPSFLSCDDTVIYSTLDIISCNLHTIPMAISVSSLLFSASFYDRFIVYI